MIGGGRAQLGGQSGAGAGTELLGVHPKAHAMTAGSGQYGARFFHGEGVIVAENIAKTRQTGRRNLRNQFFGNPAEILFTAAANSGGTVCAAKSVGTMRAGPSSSRRPSRAASQFGFAIEAVARFGFDCGGACRSIQSR